MRGRLLTSVRYTDGSMLLEVIVAIIVIATIATAMAVSFAVSSKHQLKNQIRSKQYSIAEGVMERVRTQTYKWSGDPAWAAQPGCTPASCTICDGPPPAPAATSYGTFCPITDRLAVDFQHLDENNRPVRYHITVTAAQIDASSDGTAAGDQDGNSNDAYRVSVTVVPLSNSVLANAGRTNPGVTMKSVIDPDASTRTGTLRIVMCKVVRQIDERLATNVDLSPTAAANGGQCATGNPTFFPIEKNEQCGLWDCQAFDAADIYAPQAPSTKFTSSGFQQPGVPIPFTISGIGTFSTNAAGVQTITNAAPGVYDLSVPLAGALNNLRLWDTHSVPSARKVTIEAGKSTTAFIALRPVTTSTNDIRVYVRQVDVSDPFLQKTSPSGYPTRWGVAIPEAGEVSPRLTFQFLSAPLGRTNIDKSSQWFTTPAPSASPVPLASRYVSVSGIDTGLYMMKALRLPGGQIYDITACPAPLRDCSSATPPAWNIVVTGSPSRFMWIDANKLLNVPKNVMITLYRCRPSIRNARINTYCGSYPAPFNTRCWGELASSPGYKKYLEPCPSSIAGAPSVFGGGGS